MSTHTKPWSTCTTDEYGRDYGQAITVKDSEGNYVAYHSGPSTFIHEDHAERIVACHNALLSIENPQEALRLAREALENFISVGCEFYDMDMGENGCSAIEQARAALAHLNGEPTTATEEGQG